MKKIKKNKQKKKKFRDSYNKGLNSGPSECRTTDDCSGYTLMKLALLVNFEMWH